MGIDGRCGGVEGAGGWFTGVAETRCAVDGPETEMCSNDYLAGVQ